ncbi:MAG: carboxypeptidase-like regulatory domain-containing protein [Dehalococcoidia bacterium]
MTRTLLLRPLEDVLPLNATQAAALRAAGVVNVATMFERGPRRLQRMLPDVERARLGDWYCLALLQRVPEVDAAFAAALLAAGIRTLASLAAAPVDAVEAALAGDATSQTPTRDEVTGFQEAANRLAATGMVAGQVVSPFGAPIEDASVRIGGENTTTNASGWFALNRVPAGVARLNIELPGGTDRVTGRPIEVAAGRFARLVQARVPATPRPLAATRRDEATGSLVVSRAGLTRHPVDRPLTEFPDGAPFLVREIEAERARLLSLRRVQVGRTLLVERARVDAARLPAGAAVDSVVLLHAGALVLASQTRAELERAKLDAWRATHPVTRRRRIAIL